MGDKIVIKVDSELQDIVPTFLEKRRAEMPGLWSALEKNDFTTLQTAGHRIKGNAGGYGFDHLGTIGAALEAAAKEKAPSKIAPALKEMEDHLSRVEVVYVEAA